MVVRCRGLIAIFAMLVAACGGTNDGASSDIATMGTAPATSVATLSSSVTTSSVVPSDAPENEWRSTLTCFAEPPPPYAGYEFDAGFYARWCSASGIPVIGSVDVPLVALEAAGQIVNGVIGYDGTNTAETIANGGVVILYGPNETAADLPEWAFVEGQTSHVSGDHPGFTSVGGGITFSVVVWDGPMCTVPPERQGAYGTAEWGSVLVHELGHLVAGPTTRTRLVDFVANHVTAAYEAALVGDAWDDRLYAMTNPAEYWAEATQVYFGQYSASTSRVRMPLTRVELAEQDPLVTTLLRTVYGDTTRLGTYWCDVYAGPSILLPEAADSAGYAPVP